MTPRGINKSTEAKYGQLRNAVTDAGTWDANAGASFNPALMAGTRAAAISPAAPAQSRAFHSLTSSPRIAAIVTKKMGTALTFSNKRSPLGALIGRRDYTSQE